MPATAESHEVDLANDLEASIELKVGDEFEWQVIYPRRRLAVALSDGSAGIRIRLQENPALTGVWSRVVGVRLCRASSSFGAFGDRASRWIQKQQRSRTKEDTEAASKRPRIPSAVGSQDVRASARLFTGGVIEKPNLPCICSWPGKYEALSLLQ